jgi:hypothetical protein
MPAGKLSASRRPDREKKGRFFSRLPASLAGLPDWLNLAGLIVALGVAVWSVQQAAWIKPSPSLITILVLSALSGFWLAKARWHWAIKHLLAVIIGLGVVFWQGMMILPESDFISRAIRLFVDLQGWWLATRSDAPSPVTINVALAFGYLTWITGYISTWFLVKRGNPWVAVFLGTVVILANLNFWVKDKYYFFLVYILAALVLIVLTNYNRQRSLAIQNLAARAGWAGRLWIAVSLCLIVMVTSVAWISPGFRINPVADFARARKPFSGLEMYWQNFFAPVPGSRPLLVHGGQQDLIFGGSLVLNDRVVYIIKTDHQDYWETQIYDDYVSSGWKTRDIRDTTIESLAPGTVVSDAPSGDRLSYTLIPQINSNVLPTSGDFLTGDISVVEKELTPLTFEISLTEASRDPLLPADIASLAKSIRASRLVRRRTDQQLAALLPESLKLETVNRGGNNIISLTVSRIPAEEETVVALSSEQVLAPQQPVGITVRVPPAVTIENLEIAGEDYPATITDRYLQLPATLPTRVQELAASLTQDSGTPYLKARSIHDYLVANYPYTLTINTPPSDADGVDYFLFTQKSGYCTYFASAMAVMLRSVGIPSRLVVGYLPGQYDSDGHRFLLRDRDYHAWTEIFFPGYGWVRFEATPGSSVPNGSIINLSNTAAAPTTIPVSPTPAVSPSIAPDDRQLAPSLNRFPILIPIAACGGIFLILILAVCLWLFKRPRTAAAVYSRMVSLASLARMGPRPSQTALEFSQQLSLALPRQTATINGIARSYAVYRYSQETPGALSADDWRNWPSLRRALLKRIFQLP